MSDDDLEPAAWRSSCGNEDCDWHNKHFRKPSVQNKTCPWCGDDEEVRLEPYAFTGEQVGQSVESARKLHCRRAKKGKPLCRVANEGRVQDIRCPVCVALDYLKSEVDGQ